MRYKVSIKKIEIIIEKKMHKYVLYNIYKILLGLFLSFENFILQDFILTIFFFELYLIYMCHMCHMLKSIS